MKAYWFFDSCCRCNVNTAKVVEVSKLELLCLIIVWYANVCIPKAPEVYQLKMLRFCLKLKCLYLEGSGDPLVKNTVFSKLLLRNTFLITYCHFRTEQKSREVIRFFYAVTFAGPFEYLHFIPKIAKIQKFNIQCY